MKRRLVAGSTVLAVVVAGFLITSPEAVLDELARIAARPLRFGLVLLALAAVRPFLAWPTTLLAVAVGYGYGWPGVPFGLLLVTLTALPPYWLALVGRGDGEGRVARVGERVVSATGGTRSVAASRLLPAPSDAVSVAAGVAGVGTAPFLLGTALGELPWVVAGVAVGVSADRVAAGGLSGLDPALLVGMAAAGVLLLAGPLYRGYREQSAA
ncbi:VTT domain-containing protein [Haloparvum alkalitolerans]|uniref:TVP38/TMEM64 family protein n=1 Tax=Haloparvum alkalitolerans TaxID=1042953 RepID=UPI003CEF6072